MRGSDAYLQAVKKILREDRTLFSTPEIAAASCRIMMDDRTAPNAGNLFISLYKGQVQPVGPTHLRHHELCSVVVAITLRTSDTPVDRVGASRISKERTNYPDYRLSLDEITDRVICNISHRELVIYEGNNFLIQAEGSDAYPLCTPLYYESESPNGPQIVGASHFRSEHPEGQNDGNPDTGLLNKITFGGGQRYKPLNTPDNVVY